MYANVVHISWEMTNSQSIRFHGWTVSEVWHQHVRVLSSILDCRKIGVWNTMYIFDRGSLSCFDWSFCCHAVEQSRFPTTQIQPVHTEQEMVVRSNNTSCWQHNIACHHCYYHNYQTFPTDKNDVPHRKCSCRCSQFMLPFHSSPPYVVVHFRRQFQRQTTENNNGKRRRQGAAATERRLCQSVQKAINCEPCFMDLTLQCL